MDEINRTFFITSMSTTRPADYCIGYMDGCVFIDFNNHEDGTICLKRISVDGYGCCSLSDQAMPLNIEESQAFRNMINDNIPDQNLSSIIIKKAISINSEHIWQDAMQEYYLT